MEIDYDPLSEFGPILINRPVPSNNSVVYVTPRLGTLARPKPIDENVSITVQAFEENKKTLTEAKRPQGRPRKTDVQAPTEVFVPSLYDDDSEEQETPKAPAQALPTLPPDTWGTWKKVKVTETSQVLLDWINDCRKIVLEGWNLKIIRGKHDYIFVIMQNNKNIRPFAFIDKSNGNIHKPATKDEPYEMYAAGNICDPETRLSIMTPYGVEAFWEWQPTHKDYKEFISF